MATRTLTTTSSDGAVRDKVVVITGASSGIGLETAKKLAGQGAEIVMLVRDDGRGEEARARIAEVATGKPPVLLLADLSVQAQIHRVVDEIKARYDHIDILINNAGAAFNTRHESADGLELTWAINVLAPFLLTNQLLPLLTAAPAGRIVNLTTEVYIHKLDLDNLQGERKYSWMGTYRASKLGVVLFTTELARRIKGTGVTAVSISPGPTKTNFGGGGPSGPLGIVTGVLKHTPLLKSPEQSGETIAWAAHRPRARRHSGRLLPPAQTAGAQGRCKRPDPRRKALDHQRATDPDPPRALNRRRSAPRCLSNQPISVSQERPCRAAPVSNRLNRNFKSPDSSSVDPRP